MTEYEIIASDSGVNTALAAGAREKVISEPTIIDFYNYAEIYNRNNVAVEIQFDGVTSGIKAKPIPANTIGVLEVEEGIVFKSVWQKNLDSAAAETAGSLDIKVARKKAK